VGERGWDETVTEHNEYDWTSEETVVVREIKSRSL